MKNISQIADSIIKEAAKNLNRDEIKELKKGDKFKEKLVKQDEGWSKDEINKFNKEKYTVKKVDKNWIYAKSDSGNEIEISRWDKEIKPNGLVTDIYSGITFYIYKI